MSSLARTPLDPQTLGPDAQRALSSPQAKMMAARGLVPVARPRDLLGLLYQLTVDNDVKLRQSAEQSARALPDAVLRGGLSDAQTDPRVLDLFADLFRADSGATELIIGNSNTASETIATIAGRCTASEVDRIATNEARLLAAPDIIASMYKNRHARMSTVDRVVELAIRNGVRVAGIPSWDEICKVYAPGSRERDSDLEADTADKLFERASAHHAEKDGDPAEEDQQEEKTPEIWALPVPMKIRLATLGNAFDRATLIRDPKKIVAMAAIKSPGVTDAEAQKYASMHTLPEEVVGYIANKREWTKMYSCKTSLVNNPKCPLPSAMRLLPLLREKDIQALTRSKGVPSALVAQARKLLMARGGRKR